MQYRLVLRLYIHVYYNNKDIFLSVKLWNAIYCGTYGTSGYTHDSSNGHLEFDLVRRCIVTCMCRSVVEPGNLIETMDYSLWFSARSGSDNTVSNMYT